MEEHKLTRITSGDIFTEYFHPTMHLRRYYKDMKYAFDTPVYKELIVQQMWQGSNGTQEWRDIEFWDGK